MDTYRTLALALLDADEADSPEAAIRGIYTAVLAETEGEEAVGELTQLMTVLLALTARLGEYTPRYIAELLFNEAPSDEEWTRLVDR